jgi:hypothetical protein
VFDIHLFSRRAIRAAALLSVLVLVCVPGLTRMGQKLETASHAPSFAKNIDCPPKKITIAPATAAVVSPVALTAHELVPATRPALIHDVTLPRSPQFSAPAPLRAPPSALLS